MKKSLKKITSLITLVLVTSTLVGGQAISANTLISNENAKVELSKAAAENRGKYATNPEGAVGKKATISIDGSLSGWTDDMLIAQGAAWDVANNWKGGHENSVLDSYSLYGAWDDENLYIAWQMVNTTDTWASSGDGPLSDAGRIVDVPLMIALDVGNKTAMNGKMANGKLIWDALKIEFETRVDHLFLMSGKFDGSGIALGTPGLFIGADEAGGASYDKGYCLSFKDEGIEYKMVTDSLPKEIIGLKGSDDPSDVYSNDSDWVDMMTLGHDRTYDSFYEMKIPLKTLGIDKAYVEENGIGVMQIATRGESAIDSLPHDPSMLDNALGDCAVDPSTSHEKDDTDIITVPLASVGKVRDSSVIPPVVEGKDPRISKFEADKEKININEEVKFTCTAANATSYEFTIDGEKVDKEEVSKNVLKHTFTEEGSYEVKVVAKGTSGTKDAEKTLTVVVTEKEGVSQELTISSFDASPEGKVELGKDVTLEAVAENGKGKLKYKFTVIDENDEETLIKDFSEESTAIWSTESTGKFSLNVTVIDEEKNEKTEIIEDYEVLDEDKEGKLQIKSFEASQNTEIKVSTKVDFTAVVTGAEDIEYSFTVSKDGNDAENLILNEKGNGTSWTPTKEGVYVITMTAAKDGFESVSEKKEFKVKKADDIIDEITNVELNTKSELDVKAGESIRFTAKSEGGKGAIEYNFYINGEPQGEYSSKAFFDFKSDIAGKYIITVVAKDETGLSMESAQKTVKVSEIDEPTVTPGKDFKANITSDKTSEELLGTNFKFTASSEDGEGTVKYQLMVNDVLIGEQSEKTEYEWTPSDEGVYKVSVVAYDEKGNSVKSEELTIKVNKEEEPTETPTGTPTGDGNTGYKIAFLMFIISVVGMTTLVKKKETQK